MAKKSSSVRVPETPGVQAGVKESKSMANSIVKGLALTLGGGLAVGLGIKIGQSSAPPAPVETVDFGPVLDRIEGVENRIVTVEAALKEPGPMVIPSLQELEDRVSSQSNQVEALRAAFQRATEVHDSRIDKLGYAVDGLEARLPELIEHSIKPKFEEMHERVQREMQETASQTLELFADRIQSRVVEKITSIEGDLGRQSDAINDLRDYSLKTDQNLQRLLAGVENLADKINRKFDAAADVPRTTPAIPPRPAAAPAAPVAAPPPSEPSPSGPVAEALAPEPKAAAPEALSTPAPAPAPGTTLPAPPKPVSVSAAPAPMSTSIKVPDFPSKIELGEAVDVRPLREPFQIPAPRSFSGPEFEELLAQKPRSNGFRTAVLWGGSVCVVAAGGLAVELSGVLNKPTSAHSVAVAGTKTAAAVPSGTDVLETKKLSDQSDLLDQARNFSQKKDYSKAEDIYRTILKTDPNNTEVKRLLAHVLFLQDKIEETTKVVNSLSEDKAPSTQPDTKQ
jgi:uncharacterized coiled-coil protein SlyX